jgi:hypothetical protein
MLQAAPENFLNFIKGPIPFGLYAGPVGDISTEPWARRRRMQRKAWLYAGAFSERYCVGFAIADAGIVATAFVYVFDAHKQYVEEKITAPFGFSSAFDPSLTTAWKLKAFSITRENDKLVCAYQGKRISIKMAITENSKGATTIAPAGDRPFNHTYKNLLLPAQIDAAVDGQPINLAGNIGSIDFTKGYPPRHTFWNWASMNAVTESGIAFGVNLVGDFNNSIENALWINGAVQQLSQATFVYSHPAEKNNWRVKTLDGVIDMEFGPLGMRSENINALLMSSFFKQPFGVFKGIIKWNGESHTFTGYGVVEEHLAKW